MIFFFPSEKEGNSGSSVANVVVRVSARTKMFPRKTCPFKFLFPELPLPSELALLDAFKDYSPSEDRRAIFSRRRRDGGVERVTRVFALRREKKHVSQDSSGRQRTCRSDGDSFQGLARVLT